MPYASILIKKVYGFDEVNTNNIYFVDPNIVNDLESDEVEDNHRITNAQTLNPVIEKFNMRQDEDSDPRFRLIVFYEMPVEVPFYAKISEI